MTLRRGLKISELADKIISAVGCKKLKLRVPIRIRPDTSEVDVLVCSRFRPLTDAWTLDVGLKHTIDWWRKRDFRADMSNVA